MVIPCVRCLQHIRQQYQQIALWRKMIQMTRTLEKQLKILGLNRQSERQFSRTLSSREIGMYQYLINSKEGS